MKRRLLLASGCAQCACLAAASARAQSPAWIAPDRFAKPDLASDEGGLWALMDREEVRLRRSPFLLRDPALREYLQAVACKLGSRHCTDIRVYPVRTPVFNASMAPNGMLQIWSGLLLRVENEAQLAAVLGHELGHYLQRHTLDQLRDAKARSAFMTFMGAFGVVGLIGSLAALATAFGFTRDQERQADAIGLALMRDAGYDPREASKVWANLVAETAAAPEGSPWQANPMFATHPAAEERSRTLARLAEDAAGGVVGDVEYAAKLAPVRFGLLEDEVRRGQHGESLVLLDRMVLRAPERADLLYFRAEVRRQRQKPGDLEAALADLRGAAALGNEPPQVHRALGYLYQKFEQPAAASAEFARYIELLPNAPDVELIRTYIVEGKT